VIKIYARKNANNLFCFRRVKFYAFHSKTFEKQSSRNNQLIFNEVINRREVLRKSKRFLHSLVFQGVLSRLFLNSQKRD